MNIEQARNRYENDPQFKMLVDVMVHEAQSLRFSPGELREAAVFAEIIVQRHARPQFYLSQGEIHHVPFRE